MEKWVRRITADCGRAESETGTEYESREHDPEKWVPVFRRDHAPIVRVYPRGGSAWLMTRFTVGKARRNARSISSTFSCTRMTLIEGVARQWKLTISPASVSRTRTLWMSWTAPLAAKPVNAALTASTR